MKNKSVKRKTTLFFASFVFCVVFLHFALCILRLSPAFAQPPSQTLRISPVIITIPLSPGKTHKQEVTVENLSDQPMPLRAHFSDFEQSSEDGGYVLQETLTNPLLSWTTLDQTDLLIAPKEKKAITISIKTPRSVPVGGYFAMLFFEPVIPKTNTATLVQTRIGVLLLGSIGVPDAAAKKADILDFSFGTLQETTQAPLLLRVRNTSLHHFTGKPIVTIEPLFGTPSKVILDDKFVFPGKVRRWEQTMAMPSSPNIYRVKLAFSTGEGKLTYAKTHLILFPYTKTLVLLLVVGMIVFLIVKRKRIKHAIQILKRG